MGLDQYARATNGTEDVEISYWRKHSRLQGYMTELYYQKKEEYENKPMGDKFIDALDGEDNPFPEDFNCAKVYLDEDDLDDLNNTIMQKQLPETQGFFYGGDSYDDYESEHGYKKTDIEFINKAKQYIKDGYTTLEKQNELLRENLRLSEEINKSMEKRVSLLDKELISQDKVCKEAIKQAKPSLFQEIGKAVIYILIVGGIVLLL